MSQKVELKRTELYTIHSLINFQKYDLYVRLPNSYNQAYVEKKYDVLYILNGQWDFGLMLSVYGGAYFDELVPEIILVGIGWNGQETDVEAKDYGMRDFTLSSSTGIPHKGAAKFLNILENEIIPFVENNFSSNGIRCLSGSSIAAWFALFTMFNKPSLFNKYILSSPTPRLSNGLIFNNELLFSETNRELNAQIYICYGELEDSVLIKKLVNLMESRNYENFAIFHEEIANVGHAANKPIGYTKGLLKVY